MSHAATWVTGRMRAAGVPRLAGWLEQRDVDLKAARFRGPEGPYARGAAALMVEERADVVVFGHTHATCRHELRAGLYLNPGAACGGRRAWASIDLGLGAAVVRESS